MQQTITAQTALKSRASAFFQELQSTICSALEKIDGGGSFISDKWSHTQGGGGTTNVLQNGNIFEKAGVNYSDVDGTLSEKLAARLGVAPQRFNATGISLILHPHSPMIPTVHCNVRYLEIENGDRWFGGGIDLTPYYLNEHDIVHFHTTLKNACDTHDSTYYAQFKKACDEYFYVKHRNEARGVGGIFFDYLRDKPEEIFAFIRDVGNAFLDAYIPIVQNRRNDTWGEREKQWQLHRRGRYVEFNLLHDRGTLFGLETGGRVESILMSLPPVVQWNYNIQPQPGSREAALLEVLTTPKEWVQTTL